jgi:hypothetical protein
VSGKVLQGWHPDPFGVHEDRYFSAAGEPTKLVRDRGLESYDEPPPGADEVAAAMARLSAVPNPPSAYAPRDAYGPDPGRYPRRRASGVVGLAASGIILAAAAVAAVLVAETILHPAKHASGSGSGDAALVTQAATRTLRQRTADLVLSVSAAAGSGNTTMHGAGAVDLSGKAGTLNLTARTPVGVMAFREIWLNGRLYIAGTIGGRAIAPKGKAWVSAPMSDQGSGTTDLTGGNLTASLVSLENRGNTVRALGTRVVGGIRCTGYTVTSPDGKATTTVWINPQDLVREISGDATLADAALSGGASASTAPTDATSAPPVSVDVTMDFTYSPVPLRVTAPPAASTVS